MCNSNNNDAKKAMKWQKKQAADAAKKEAERQARLTEGKNTVNALFDGKAVMGERDATYDWKAFNDAAAKAAAQGNNTQQRQTRVSPQVPMTQGANDRNGDSTRRPSSNQNSSQNQNTGARNANAGAGAFKDLTLPEGYTVVKGKGGWQIVDKDGKVYKSGDALTYKEKYDTGAKEGGFGDSFYNKYRDATMNFYTPELQKQYTKAKSNLTFDHARAGTLQSSMASENLSDLVYQNTMNEASLNSKADNATTQLKNSVAGQKTNALTQLYATEDPSIAANTATNSVRTLQNTTPDFSPLGEMFRNAVVGASNYASAYNDQRNWGSTPSGNSGSGSGRNIS